MDKYHIPYIGKRLLARDIEREGGQMVSPIARERTLEEHHVDVGMYTYGGCFEDGFNFGGSGVKVGRYCSIARHVTYYGASHPVEHAVMSPYFYNKAFSGFDVEDVERGTLEIGNDVWIGDHVLIMPGCKCIGNGSVLGGGCIVTHSVEPYAIVAGSPARPIRRRFDDETIAALEASAWWELTPQELMEFYALMDRPLEFAQTVIEAKNNG